MSKILHRGLTALMMTAAVAMPTTSFVVAQEEVTHEKAVIVLTASDGIAIGEYRTQDVGVYLASQEGYEGVDPSTSLTLSLSGMTPVDEGLLAWAAQKAGADPVLYNMEITTDIGDDKAAAVYVVSNARVTSTSTSHSIYNAGSLSLQLAADTLSLNGFDLN
ncbi:hypothetical protein [Devosia submarina]|uniref:hypothetical protein n=1 Tax=Devosia submarina TaxID=1173082 RepID=UPI0013008CCF|nr:hypothetical protein [Devosia submarina]